MTNHYAQLVLVRHGESAWNKLNVFTGWVDVPLSSEGIIEAIKAGEKLSTIEFDVIFTSIQIRAIETAMLIMTQNKTNRVPVIIHNKGIMESRTKIYSSEMKRSIIPVCRDWRLNERYYGELQGKNKAETEKQYGMEQVHIWRRSYDVPPPSGESLSDTAQRTVAFFKSCVIPVLEKGKNILISAHGNSLRSILMFIENLTKEQVQELEIPTAKPICYTMENKLLQIKTGKE